MRLLGDRDIAELPDIVFVHFKSSEAELSKHRERGVIERQQPLTNRNHELSRPCPSLRRDLEHVPLTWNQRCIRSSPRKRGPRSRSTMLLDSRLRGNERNPL